MNDRSATTRSTGSPTIAGSRSRTFVRSTTAHPRIAARAARGAGRSRRRPPRPRPRPRCSRQSVKPPVEAPASSDPPARRRRRRSGRARRRASPPRPTHPPRARALDRRSARPGSPAGPPWRPARRRPSPARRRCPAGPAAARGEPPPDQLGVEASSGAVGQSAVGHRTRRALSSSAGGRFLAGAFLAGAFFCRRLLLRGRLLRRGLLGRAVFLAAAFFAGAALVAFVVALAGIDCTARPTADSRFSICSMSLRTSAIWARSSARGSRAASRWPPGRVRAAPAPAPGPGAPGPGRPCSSARRSARAGSGAARAPPDPSAPLRCRRRASGRGSRCRAWLEPYFQPPAPSLPGARADSAAEHLVDERRQVGRDELGGRVAPAARSGRVTPVSTRPNG